jgi:hypothetical protein
LISLPPCNERSFGPVIALTDRLIKLKIKNFALTDSTQVTGSEKDIQGLAGQNGIGTAGNVPRRRWKAYSD